MKLKKLFFVFLLPLVTACNNPTVETPSSGADYVNSEDDYVASQTWNTQISIVWDGASATIEGNVDGVEITNSNGYVKVTSTVKYVEYVLSGNGTGQFKIYSDYKYKMSLSGLTLTCSDGPAINNQCTKSCYVVVLGTNSLADTKGYNDELNSEDQKGAFFSEGQVLVSGDGSLSITGNNKHAFASDDYIRIFSSTLNITSNVNDGIHTNDAVIINGGDITVKAVDDGVQVDEDYFIMTDGNLTITTTGTSAKGIKAYGNLEITGGTVSVTTPGRESEGIESKAVLNISGGTVYVLAYDDAINSGSHMNISGGTITAISTGNDGLDANGNIYIKGGTTMAFGTSSPECGLDANEEQNYSVYFTGGALLAVGGDNSTPSSSQSTQPYVTGSLSVSAGNTVSLSSGTTTLASFTIPAAYNSSSQSSGWGGHGGMNGGSSVLITCEGLTSGTSYTLSNGSSTTSVSAQQYGSSNGGGPGGQGGGGGRPW